LSKRQRENTEETTQSDAHFRLEWPLFGPYELRNAEFFVPSTWRGKLNRRQPSLETLATPEPSPTLLLSCPQKNLPSREVVGGRPSSSGDNGRGNMTAPFREKQLPQRNSVPAALRHLCGNLRFAHPLNWGIPNPPPIFSRPFARQVVQIELELSAIAPRLQRKNAGQPALGQARADGLWANRNRHSVLIRVGQNMPKYKD
jgi:hypothetical protein